VGKDDFLRMAAPMAAAGTVYLAGRALRGGYQAATGAPAPRPDDLETPVLHVVIFAIATAAVTAVINVTIQRGVAKASANRSLQKHAGPAA
jgi:Protein of unknown function (DUF4235)